MFVYIFFPHFTVKIYFCNTEKIYSHAYTYFDVAWIAKFCFISSSISTPFRRVSSELWANWTGWMYAIFACKRIPQRLDRKEASIQKCISIWMFRRVCYQIWIICTYFPDKECVSLFWRFFLLIIFLK